MKTTSMALALCALMFAGACSKDQTSTTSSAAGEPSAVTRNHVMTPEQLGELGAEIKKNPNDAERLLTEHGLDEQTFEQAVRKVSEDPAASRRYAESYRKAGA